MIDNRIHTAERLLCNRDLAVHTNAQIADGEAGDIRHNGWTREQIARAVDLCCLEVDVARRAQHGLEIEAHRYDVAGAGVEVLLHLGTSQRSVMDGYQPEDTAPKSIVRDLVAQHELLIIEPVQRVAGSAFFDGKLTVDVDAATDGAIVGRYYVGQVRVDLWIECLDLGCAIRAGTCAAIAQLVVNRVLPQR